MANIYVKHTGSNTSPYDSWAKAATKLANADAVDAAGDTVYVSASHSETSGTSQTANFTGSASAPVRVICVSDDTVEPPVVAATGAVVATNADFANIQIGGTSSYTYVEGIRFNLGTSTNLNIALFPGQNSIFAHFKNCVFAFGGTGGNYFRPRTNGRACFENCQWSFAGTTSADSFNLFDQNGTYHINGGELMTGTAAITTFLNPGNGYSQTVLVENFDLSRAAQGVNLVTQTDGYSNRYVFRNCKLPSGWTGSLHSGTPASDSFYAMYNCDAGDTNYRLWTKTRFGEVKSETTLVRTGGASDGTTTISWRMDSTSLTIFPYYALTSPEIHLWNETVGSSKTLTVEILHDSATALKDDEIWLEVSHLGTSGFPLGVFAHDAKANTLGTGSDQASSSETWTTTGMSNPNKQKLSVTFTPQEKGVIIARVRLAKASKTVYVDPKATLS